MLEVKSSRIAKKVLLATLIGGLTFTAPVAAVKAFAADEEVLFEDQDDDYKTEDIKEDDVVKDNTVVEPVQEETKEEPKQEEKKEEEKKNDGGSCVTPDNGYDEKAGQYWDPSIKTEVEKKHLVPDTPPETPPTPPTPPVTPPETPVNTPETPAPAPAPTPAPAPKTGDITLNEIFALLAGLSIGGAGISYVASKVTYDKAIKRK